MEYTLTKIIDSNASRKHRLQAFEILERYKAFKFGFSFGFQNKANFPLMFRYSIGTFLAIGGATVNLYRIRQTIIKYAIMYTKSKNVKLIRTVY